ncbi:hypothetical protein SCOCK_20265 [Actinacidiphila cocklensis]|uniref:Uncharacterized protein n=1 Tax=Actinacidiphila cocklensis TaxID=887465 RepID=A0A9W4DSN2_9ACTN|nr:hypothetical protein SCOCK_20265 [Actinacidiphila cocklensis]
MGAGADARPGVGRLGLRGAPGAGQDDAGAGRGGGARAALADQAGLRPRGHSDHRRHPRRHGDRSGGGGRRGRAGRRRRRRERPGARAARRVRTAAGRRRAVVPVPHTFHPQGAVYGRPPAGR